MASNKLHGTIDTVSMQNLCRTPALRVREPKKRAQLGLSLIHEALEKKRLLIYLDIQGGLRDEWAKTCGYEIIAQLVIVWSDLNGLIACQAKGAIKPPRLNKTLQDCQFSDAGDKLIVRIGLTAIKEHKAPSFTIATNDGDFWDPKDGKSRGDAKAPVANALALHQIHSTLLLDFFSLVSQKGAA